MPSRAEAEPALARKGAMARASVLGRMRPWQARKRNRGTMTRRDAGSGGGADQQQKAGESLPLCAAAQQKLRRMGAEEARVPLRKRHHAKSVETEDDAERPLAESELADEDERRAVI